MRPENLFPLVLMLLDVSAAIAYLTCRGDLKHAIYWIAAATLTATVTF